jgi:hypothetical protein
MKTECSCSRCVSACEVMPGKLLPAEARRAIDAGMAGSLMLDWYDADAALGNEETVYHLMPAAVGREGGTAADVDELFPTIVHSLTGQFVHQPCTLLVAGKCSIHLSGFKPAQCRALLACEDGVVMENIEIARAWNNPVAQAIVAEWKRAVGGVERAA